MARTKQNTIGSTLRVFPAFTSNFSGYEALRQVAGEIFHYFPGCGTRSTQQDHPRYSGPDRQHVTIDGSRVWDRSHEPMTMVTLLPFASLPRYKR